MTDVLIVDGSRLARHRAREPLVEAGHEVREAEDAAEAWAHIDARAPDAIVADAGLPGREAEDLLDGLRERPVAVVVATTGDEAETSQALRELGAADVVAKDPLYGVRVGYAVDRLTRLPEGSSPQPAEPGCVLVVDDSPLIRRVVADILTDAEVPLVVEGAEDGETGLEQVRDDGYDAVLIDHQLPGMSGLELLAALRDEGVQTPAMALTGERDPDVAERFREAGALGVWTKEHERPGRLRAVVGQLARIGRARVGEGSPPRPGP